MFLSYAVGVAVVVLILLRQLRIRPVRRTFTARLPVVLGVLGLFGILSYIDSHHHLTSSDYEWMLGTLLVGAVLLGALRGLTVRVWSTNNWVVRQGTTLTMALWAASLALHFYVDSGGGHLGAEGLEQSSLLLYVALTIGVQAYVVYRRALPLWQALGPEAGRRFQVNFGTGPGGMSSFFANFGGGPPGPGFGGPQGSAPPPSWSGPGDVIDAEVVEDEDPPELPTPR
jgi:hypothetical protein